MRCLLTILFIFFIANSCFASKFAVIQPAFQSSTKNKTLFLKNSFDKLHSDEESNVNKDECKRATLLQPLLKKQTVAYVQLFKRTGNQQVHDPLIKTYVYHTQLNHLFIYHFLFPKHVFW